MKNAILAAAIILTFFGLLSYYGFASFDTPEQTKIWSNGYYITESVIHCLLWLLVIYSCNPAPLTKTILWLMFGTMALRLLVIIVQSFTSWYTVTTSVIPLILWAVTMITICILSLIKRH